MASFATPLLILLLPFILLLLERVPKKKWLSELGLNSLHPDQFFQGVKLFVIIFGVLVAQGIILNQFHLLDTQNVRDIAQAQGADFIFIAVVLAPLGEELLFRGYLVSRLAKKFNVVFAVLSTSVLFAFLHFGYGSVAEVSSAFIYSAIVGYWFAKNKDIVPVITAHFLMNVLFFLTL